MKGNQENLKNALMKCAKAHCVSFCDWSDEDYQFALLGENIPLLADVRTICDAFYGNHRMVKCEYGFVVVYLDECDFKEGVNEMLLKLALPFNW